MTVIHPAAVAKAQTRDLSRTLERGMIGGPTGFPGARRYQYGPNTAAGRAILGLKKFTNNGKKRLDLKMRMWNGATGQLSVPFPKGAPSVADQLLKEANVKLHLTAIAPTDQITKITVSTRDGSNPDSSSPRSRTTATTPRPDLHAIPGRVRSQVPA
jgi:multiple sugar transport system substrate-binding protein